MINTVAAPSSLGPVIDRLQTSVVAVQDGERGSGAGVIWQHGVIVTNAHVARGSSVIVTFHYGTCERDAQVIGRDEERDLAAVTVQSAHAPAAIGNTARLRTGEMVIAIGHPLGVEGAATFGIVNRPPVPGKREFITSSIYLNRGNSGGPLANAAGQVIGINTMVLMPGIGLAIPASSVQDFLRQTLGPEVRIGFTVQQIDVPAIYADEFKLLSPTSLLVTEVEAESAAEEAGLLPGDLILTVGDREMVAPRLLQDEISRGATIGSVEIEILRGRDRKKLRSRVVVTAQQACPVPAQPSDR